MFIILFVVLDITPDPDNAGVGMVLYVYTTTTLVVTRIFLIFK